MEIVLGVDEQGNRDPQRPVSLFLNGVAGFDVV